MDDRRQENRILASHLLRVEWREGQGRPRTQIVNLEDISADGACLQGAHALIRGTEVTLQYGKGRLRGQVQYCYYRDGGYFFGIQFAPGQTWTEELFPPDSLFDPSHCL